MPDMDTIWVNFFATMGVPEWLGEFADDLKKYVESIN